MCICVKVDTLRPQEPLIVDATAGQQTNYIDNTVEVIKIVMTRP